MNGENSTLVEEVQQKRWWRYRCGEPNLDRYPVRCRRDLNHPAPHAGMLGELVIWDGGGNAVSAQAGPVGYYRCWGGCPAHPERRVSNG